MNKNKLKLHPYVYRYFLERRQAWVFDIMNRDLQDPTLAPLRFIVQFGLAMSKIGRQNVECLGPALYKEVMMSRAYQEVKAESHRILKQVKRQNLAKKRGELIRPELLQEKKVRRPLTASLGQFFPAKVLESLKS